MANFISLTVLSVLLLCGVHLTSGIPTPNTLSASGLTVYAIAGDMVYQQQVNSSSWGHQLGNNSQVLYICNRVAYHDLLNATRENGNLTVSTDETATVMSESMNILCEIMVSDCWIIACLRMYK